MCDTRNPREPGQEPAEIQGSLSRKCHLCLPPGLQYILLKKDPGTPKGNPGWESFPPNRQSSRILQRGGCYCSCLCVYRRLGGVSPPLGRPPRNREIVSFVCSCVRARGGMPGGNQVKIVSAPFPFYFFPGGFPFSLWGVGEFCEF